VQVAYALLVQLVLEERDSAFLNDMLRFYSEIGLPKTLAAMGVQLSNEALIEIAKPSLLAPHARNFERDVTTEEMIAAMQRLEAWPGSANEAGRAKPAAQARR
jgi:glycerol dehydrogenase